MRKVALIILYNKEKKILLQHRDSNSFVNASKWGLFGGLIEKDEAPLQAVKRECKEELDYDLKNPKLIFGGIYGDCYAYVYLEEYDFNKKLILGEGQSMDWFSLEESRKLDTSKPAIEAIEKTFNLKFKK